MAGDSPCKDCGHPKRSHKHAGGNKHGKYEFHSSCKMDDCDCQNYRGH